MSEFGQFIDLNRDLWNKRVRGHLEHRLYPSAQVEAGTYEVSDPDRDDVGEVAGRRLIHLQCNAGADTLYWARRGAIVTGVDFSEVAIVEARRLSDVTGLAARFVCSDIYDVPQLDLGPFDIAYVSLGSLWWIPDVERWAAIVTELLVPGGLFYITDVHPFAMALQYREDHIVVAEDYFGPGEALVFETDGTYYETADDFTAELGTECGWVHTLGDVVSALSGAGLRIELLREHSFTFFRMFPRLVRDEHGRWTTPEGTPRVPLMFSLRARR